MSLLEIVQSMLIVVLFLWNIEIVAKANENTRVISNELRRLRSGR